MTATIVSRNIVTDLAELAERRAWSRRPAFHVDGRTWTHGEVHDLAARIATVLADHGVLPGRRVLVALPDGIGWVGSFLAVARLGAVAVLVNPDLPVEDHRYLAEDCAATLVVSGPAVEDRFDRGRWLDIDRLMALAAQAPRAEACPVDARTPLYVQYTSGTTGRPKGVLHQHGDLRVYADAVANKVLGIGHHDVAFSISKLFYAYGFGNALVFPLFSGSAAVLTSGRPSADAVAELIARHRVSVLYGVPSAFAALLEAGDAGQFRSLRAAVSAGEGLPPALVERVPELLRAPVLEQIGSTEAGHAFCANRVGANVPGTVGRPVPGFQLQLRDEAGRVVCDGAEGELWVRGPTLFAEYLNQPEKTAQTLVNGWLNTRDRACRNPDGTYRHTGRVDDLEMVGGITLSPLEVEQVLLAHPLVREAAVASVLDDQGATRLRAFVVPAGEDADAASLERELITLARRRLAAFKVPRTVRIVPALPRTPTGKLRRHVVRAGAW